jgi:hypothetical protein
MLSAMAYPMPPKRRTRSEDENSDSSERTASPLPVHQHPVTIHHAAAFAVLPTEAILSQIVGVATRLSATIAALTYRATRGDERIYRDCIRVVGTALATIEPAIYELAAMQIVLRQKLENLTDGLQNIPPSTRRPRR